MPHRNRRIVVRLLFLLAAAPQPAPGAPPFELSDGGRTFLYRARPGEPPSVVAERFGVPRDRLGAFLAANGISDPRRVPLGFEYRIPNPLGPRLEALGDRVRRLERDAVAWSARVADLERTNEQLARQAGLDEANARRLAALEWRWPITAGLLVLALLALAGALWTTRAAVARLAPAEERARALAQELELRRQAALTERQEAGRRIVELENRVRVLEIPRRATGGRT
jgi:hypothetical protein